MGAGGVPNRTVVRIDGKRGSLPTRGAKPNSRYDLYLNGEKIQSRWFDTRGMVERNRDFSHQDIFKRHYFPHDHTWKWISGEPKRNKNFIETDYINYK